MVALFGRGRLGGFRRGRHRSSRGSGGFTAQNLEHDCAAGWAFAFDGFPPVLHRFFDRIDYFLFRLAFDAVSFGHKKLPAPMLHAP
jgi:hypothetical protein